MVEERDRISAGPFFEGLAEDARVCDLVSISWIDSEGNVAWTRPVPPHMRDLYVCVSENSVCGETDAAPSSFSSPLTIFAALVTEKWIAIPDRNGLLILDLASGAVLLDWAALAPRHERSFVVDTAHYRVEGLSCEGQARSGRPLVVCGDNLLFFSGQNAVLIDVRDWSVAVSGQFTSQTEKNTRITTRIRLGKWLLVLDGLIFRCGLRFRRS